jgi:UTP-glucose-1-phosphate uridylyltransferase
MAAGMGNRYGGLKQIDPVGPGGQIIIDYSMFDAIAAGFDKIVFVIRHYFEDAFKEKISRKLEDKVETAYAYQELDASLGGFTVPSGRQKPWGTGHAILVAEGLIVGPFAVINADDYYGPNSFKAMKNYLNSLRLAADCENEYAMIGYTLRNTLSEYGAVCRGVCQCDEEMLLEEIVERINVKKQGQGATCLDGAGQPIFLTGDEVVSANFWGFQPSVFGHLERLFRDFLDEHGQDTKAEFYIPTAIDTLIHDASIRVKVLPAKDKWFGVTYKQDMPGARKCIRELIDQGVYPEDLWQVNES